LASAASFGLSIPYPPARRHGILAAPARAAEQSQGSDWTASALWLAIFDAKAQRRKEIEESESGTQELKKKRKSWPVL
jgi:hypothetical protein